MKQILLCSVAASLLFVQCNRQLVPDSSTVLYPTPTKYTITLYAAEAKKEGSNNTLAGHVVLKGPGQFTWQVPVDADDDFDVVAAYSVRKEGATLTINGGKDEVAASIQVTKGVYDEGTEWYRFNCERKTLAGTIYLQKGVNAFTLKITTPDPTFETVIYTLELIPHAKKSAAVKDILTSRVSRPDMDWFTTMKYGLMFHWTSLTTPRTGPVRPYKDAVNEFDVGAFVKMVESTGADYIIFTGCWAETYIPSPLKNWEREYPGHTTQRDLIAEISDSLAKRNIRFILYLSTHVYAQFDKVNTQEFSRLNNELLTEIGEHYKDKISGFWFDGWYQSYQKHPGFDFETFYRNCKTGNPRRLVALNSWLYPIVTEWQDYWAGEIYSPGTLPGSKVIKSGPGTGLQFHSLLALEDDWAHTVVNTEIKSPRLQARDIINYISGSEGKGPVTINIEIYQDGKISSEAMVLMESIKQSIKSK